MCDSLMLNVVQYAFWVLILLSHLNSQMNDLFDFREEKIMQTSLHSGKFDQVLDAYGPPECELDCTQFLMKINAGYKIFIWIVMT